MEEAKLNTPTALVRLLESERPLLADGAMGSMIHARGIGFDQCFDELNLTQPGVIAEIHRAYIEAGSDLIMTNTFGGNRFRLAKHGLEEKVVVINTSGVDLARKVVSASFKDVLVAGDVGPLGVRLAPFGRVQPEQAREAFREQIAALVNAGVDLLIFETFGDLYEIREALEAARSLTDLPIIASMTFTRDDRTLLGNPPAEVARTLYEGGANIIGINCSEGPSQILRILHQMRAAVPDAKFSVMPNAGLPEQVDGRIMYPATPAYFGEFANVYRKLGVRVVGGCCGTTPRHISCMHEALLAPPAEDLDGNGLVITERDDTPLETLQPTDLAQKLAAGKFITTIELAPPRGLRTQKVLAAASMLAEAGADAVNIADAPMARMRMSAWAVSSLIQQRVGLETVLHFPTRGRNILRVQGDLLASHALNTRNIFVVMGDPTAIGDYPDAMDDYDVVPSGLIRLIKQGFNVGMDYSGAEIDQPTSFFVGCALNLTPANYEREGKVLQRKTRAGADYALTQPVFDPSGAKKFLDWSEDNGQKVDIPIVVGILPLYNIRHALFLHNEVPGITIPETIQERMRKAEDPAKEGQRIAIELIEQTREWASGAYLIPPFRRYDITAEIIEAVQETERTTSS